MILSNTSIAKAIRENKLVLDPLPEREQFAPSALDLRVGDQFLSWKPSLQGTELRFDLSTINVSLCSNHLEPVPPEPDGRIQLNPNAFMLAQTRETILLKYSSRLAARIEGRSSYARLGLQVHMTAPTIHCGFEGTITLELKNCGQYPLLITPNKTCICQLIFETVKDKPTGPFKSNFLHQRDPIGRH